MVTYMDGVHPSIRNCTAYAATDHVLGPTLIFIDIQSNGIVASHIYTIAGYKHYPRLLLNHTNPAYQSAVSYLSTAKQGSELHRGLAITIMRFFIEMPGRLQWVLQEYNLQNEKANPKSYESWSVIPVAFEGQHAAELAGRMSQVDGQKFLNDFVQALSPRTLSWLDVDIVIRGGNYANEEELSPVVKRILDFFGESTCLPSSKLQRAPSQFNHSRHKSFVENRDPAVLEREVTEMVTTERNYVNRITALMNELVYPMRSTAHKLAVPGAFPSEAELAGLFPGSLDEIVELNSDFATELEEVWEQDGIEGFARVCLEYFPLFKSCYEDYLRASPNFTQLYSIFARNRNDLFYKLIESVGEQQFKSWLIEPVQRLPRYSLYIDNILNHVEIGSDTFINLNKARDIITDICSLKASDSAERSQTTKRLQSMIPSWPAHLKPKGRLITAVDFYEILPPYNTQTSESLASILLLFPDVVVLLRRPKSTTLMARGIITEVERPASMKTPTASKKEGLDLVFAGWCDLENTKIVEAEDGSSIWMEHHADLLDNWAKGGEAGFRKFVLINAYERKAKKFTEEVALARQERRCAGEPKGLVAMRYKNEGDTTCFWSAVWGNEYEGYRMAPMKSKYVIFIGEQPGSLHGSLEAELEDGYEIVMGVEPVSTDAVKFEIRALGHISIQTVPDSHFFSELDIYLGSCFREMNSMEYEPETRAPGFFSANERLLRSFNVSYDGHASRLTKKLRPPSPVKILSQVFGSSAVGSGNSSPAKMAKPILLIGERTRLPPPGMSRTESSEAAQKITLVKDESESPDAAGMGVFTRLEKLVEVYIQGMRNAMQGNGFNLMGSPEYDKTLDERLRGKAIEACNIYNGFVKFLREEWSDKVGTMVGRRGLEILRIAFERPGEEATAEFQEIFADFLSEMTPQNRRAFKNVMFFLAELLGPLQPSDQAMILPSFVNLLHLDEYEDDEINYDAKYLRMIMYIANNSEDLFSDTPRSHEVSLESTPVRETRTRRANTMNTVGIGAAQTLRKKFNQVAGSIRGESHYKSRSQESNEPIGRVASVLRSLSKKERSRLLTSKSVDEGMGNNTIKPVRPGSSDRPTLNTAFTSLSKESVASYPLETIVASPTGTAKNTGALGAPPKRKKRRSSLSDLRIPKGPEDQADSDEKPNLNSVILADIPVRPAAPPPLEYSHPRTETNSSAGSEVIRPLAPVKRTPSNITREATPDPPASPSPAQGLRRDKGYRDRCSRESKQSVSSISRKPVPTPSSSRASSTRVSSNPDRTLRAPPASKQLRDRVSMERANMNEAEATVQKEFVRIGEEIQRKNQRSRGNSSTASSSVASSTSSTYSTSISTAPSTNAVDSEVVKRMQSIFLTMMSDLRAKYDEVDQFARLELLQKEEFIKDQSIKLAQKDLEIQSLKTQLGKIDNDSKMKDTMIRNKDVDLKKKEDALWEKENELKQKKEALRLHVEDARKKDEVIRTLMSEVNRLESDAKRAESKSVSESKQKLLEIEAAALKREEEYKAELKKRDRAMKGLNKLYEELNLEQDELFKRCNEELETIARAAASSVGVGRNGEDVWKCLERARANEAQMRKEMGRLRREVVKLKARIEDENSGSSVPSRPPTSTA